MQQSPTTKEQRPVWFVGSAFAGHDDQTDRFLQDGVWENGYTDRYIDDVKSMVVGDRIAIKASYTQKHGLPFDNRGHPVSVMKIKAVGKVTKNMEDGRHLMVDWTVLVPPREWFFYTNRRALWKVQYGSGAQPLAAYALIQFVFDGEDQDLDWFRNLPFWHNRFGDGLDTDERFAWTRFYAEIADQLVQYRDDRLPLISALIDIGQKVSKPFPTKDEYSDGTEGPLQDICPFTTMACFNRSISESIREVYARGLKAFLGVHELEPEFDTVSDGIPTLMPLNSWFFAYEKNRAADDIETLWTLLERHKIRR
jgi:5-methylcytosine-specific restriction protein B